MSRIAYVSSYMGGTSGAGQSAVDVLIAILLANNSVTVISNTGKRCRLPAQVEGQIIPPPRWITPPRPFPKQVDRRFPHRLAGWFVNVIQDPFWARRLRQLGPPDLTVVNSFNQPLLDRVSQINPRLKSKTAIVVRGSPKEATFQNVGLSVDWAVGVLGEYGYLIFVSSQCQQEWLTFPSLVGKKSFYIPNCCREDVAAHLMAQDRAQVRRRLGLPSSQFVAVCVASVQQRKGQDLLLDYFPAFLEVAPGLVMYLIGGIGSAWGRSLCQQIKASRLSDRLRVLGTKLNAMDYIRAADVLLLPSRAEAMPRVILEAMALKTPVIASDVGGILELIEHGQSGLLFSHDEPTGLVDAFKQMADNPDLRRAFAERAQQRYWSNFSRAHHIKRCSQALKIMLTDD